MNPDLLHRPLPESLSELILKEADLCSYSHSLPTRIDLEHYLSHLEAACKTEICAFRAEVSNIGSHINDIEAVVEISYECF